MFDYSKEWGKSEPQRILEIFKDVGLHRLMNLDGCICSSCEIRDVKFDISCGKGRDRGVWISCRSSDWPKDQLPALLADVGKEIQRQVGDLNDGRGPIPVHYGEWTESVDAKMKPR